MKNWQHQSIMTLASGFQSGYLPKIPGTWGTMSALPLYFLLHLLSFGYLTQGLGFIVFWLVCFCFGIWICDYAEKQSQNVDPGWVVWDEIVAFLPCIWLYSGWTLILAFVLFRIFDAWKPWPICWFEQHLKGGFAIMFDDLLAFCYVWLVILALGW